MATPRPRRSFGRPDGAGRPPARRGGGERYERRGGPGINSLNFYIHDILQDGVSSNNKKDGQAKSLGEYLRSKKIKVPESIIGDL